MYLHSSRTMPTIAILLVLVFVLVLEAPRLEATGEILTIPVQHEPYGAVLEYNIQITLGTPPSTKLARLDTGSDLIWVQCRPCVDCFSELDPIFNPTNSSSYSSINCSAPLCEDLGQGSYACSSAETCEYGYAYGDGSTTRGFLAFENFTLTSSSGSTSVFPIAFGCGEDNVPGSLFLYNGTDGIVGLGRGPLSLISQLGIGVVPVFSYCLVDFAAAGNKTSLLLLGSAGNSTLNYTRLYPNSFKPSFYYVNLTGILVNSQAVDFPPETFQIGFNGTGGIILDSGTSVTSIIYTAYTPFIRILIPLITYPLVSKLETGLDYCYNISGVTNPTFPEVVFQFETLDVSIPQGNLFSSLLLMDEDIPCLVVQNGTDPAADGPSIFGNIMQQNFQIAYDLVNNQVGFAPTVC